MKWLLSGMPMMVPLTDLEVMSILNMFTMQMRMGAGRGGGAQMDCNEGY